MGCCSTASVNSGIYCQLAVIPLGDWRLKWSQSLVPLPMMLPVLLKMGICLLASVASAVLSVVAVVLYSVDLFRNPEEECVKLPYDNCDHHYATVSTTLITVE